MAERWKWSRTKVQRFLDMLKTRQQITIQKSNVISKIIILKYDEYQCQENNRKTPEKQQKDTYNNVKNVKNDKNNKEDILLEHGASAPSPKDKAVEFFSSPEARERATEFVVSKGVPDDAARREIAKFVSYWTEPTHSGKKQRWQTERTFEVGRRLATWLSRAGERKTTHQEPKGITL
jgi:hypothetical protein